MLGNLSYLLQLMPSYDLIVIVQHQQKHLVSARDELIPTRIEDPSQLSLSKGKLPIQLSAIVVFVKIEGGKGRCCTLNFSWQLTQ